MKHKIAKREAVIEMTETQKLKLEIKLKVLRLREIEIKEQYRIADNAYHAAENLAYKLEMVASRTEFKMDSIADEIEDISNALADNEEKRPCGVCRGRKIHRRR